MLRAISCLPLRIPVRVLRPLSFSFPPRPHTIPSTRAIPDRGSSSVATNDEEDVIREVSFRPEMENSVQMIGFLGKDPEFFEFNTGTVKTVLLLGMKQRRTKRNHWFEVAVWGPLAYAVRDQFQKGSEVYIHGKLEQDSWTDSKSGKTRSKVIIVAKSVHTLADPNSVPFPPSRRNTTSSKE